MTGPGEYAKRYTVVFFSPVLFIIIVKAKHQRAKYFSKIEKGCVNNSPEILVLRYPPCELSRSFCKVGEKKKLWWQIPSLAVVGARWVRAVEVGTGGAVRVGVGSPYKVC